MMRWMRQNLRGRLLLPLIAIAAFGLAACSDDDNGSGPGPTPVDEFALAASAGDAYLTAYTSSGGLPMNPSADQVWSTSSGEPGTYYYIIDYRSLTHFDHAHIAGAHQMALASLVDNLATLPTDKTILNVCYSGQTASTATAILNLLGYDAQNLKFGMYGWTSDLDAVGRRDGSGNPLPYPVVDDYASWLSTVETTRPAAGAYPTISTGQTTALEILKARADAYVTAGWKTITAANLYAELNNVDTADDWFVVNYFPATQYAAGHIPGAVRYQPNSDLQRSTFLNTLPTNKKIVVYCWTGQTSAQVVAYLNILGYDAYSMSFGVHAMCGSNTTINTSQFHTPTTSYPVVPTT